MPTPRSLQLVLLGALAFELSACGVDAGGAEATTTSEASTVSTTESVASSSDAEETDGTSEAETTESTVATFTAEVWADNWFALYVNGDLIAEDSVPITTERSFNSETITFEATYPLTIGLEAMDYTETNSGLEYIGEANQQMGDGGIIAQITDESTGEVVAVTNADWAALVVYKAPLNVECVDDTDPDATCEYLILETPEDWATSDFDAGDWDDATEWSSAAVDPKDGYSDIEWDPSAQFIWGADLDVDNTVLLRLTVAGT